MSGVTQAHASDSSLHAEGGYIRILADSTQDVNADASVVSVTAALIGVAGAGGHAATHIDSTVEAFAQDASLTASGDLFVDADSTHHARANTFGLAASLGFAVSTMISEASVEGATRAYIDGNSTIVVDTRADITADSDAHALPAGDSISVGLVSGAVTIMDADVNRVTEAFVGKRAGEQTRVDTRLDRIKVGEQADPWDDAEIVTYSDGGGTAIGGLQNGAQYYVLEGYDGQIQLAEVRDVESLVDTDDNTILVGEQGEPLTTGEAVVYDEGDPGGQAIGGLVDGVTYYVIKLDDGLVKLASSLANANNGIAIDLTTTGSGDNHLAPRISASTRSR